MDKIDFMSAGNLAVLAFGSAFVFVSLVLIYFGIKNIRLDISSQSWPVTEGGLIDTEIIKHVRRDDENRSRTYTHYTSNHTYLYKVSGEEYRATEEISAKTREEAVTLSKLRKPGSKVSLYYDPEDASQSRFHLSNPYRNWIWFLGALIFSLFGLGVSYLGLFHVSE